MRSRRLRPDPTFKLPDDRQIGYELNEPNPTAKDKRSYWRSLLPRARRAPHRQRDLRRDGQLRPEHEPPDRAPRLQPLRQPRVRRPDGGDRRQEARDHPRRQGQERADHQRRDPRWSRVDHHGRQRSGAPGERAQRARQRAEDRLAAGAAQGRVGLRDRSHARHGRDREDPPVVRPRHRSSSSSS